MIRLALAIFCVLVAGLSVRADADDKANIAKEARLKIGRLAQEHNLKVKEENATNTLVWMNEEPYLSGVISGVDDHWAFLARAGTKQGKFGRQILVVRISEAEAQHPTSLSLKIDGNQQTIEADDASSRTPGGTFVETAQFKIPAELFRSIGNAREAWMLASGETFNKEIRLDAKARRSILALDEITETLEQVHKAGLSVFDECREIRISAELARAAADERAKRKEQDAERARLVSKKLSISHSPAALLPGQVSDEWFTVTLTNQSEHHVRVAQVTVMRGKESTVLKFKDIAPGKSKKRTFRLKPPGKIECKVTYCGV